MTCLSSLTAELASSVLEYG